MLPDFDDSAGPTPHRAGSEHRHPDPRRVWKGGLNSTPGTTNVINVIKVMNFQNADLAVKTHGLHTLTPPGKLAKVP